MPGPPRIVKVNAETLGILDVENTEFGANNPQKLGGYGNELYVGGWSREELVPDSLSDQEIHRPENDEEDTDNSDDEEDDGDNQLEEDLPTDQVLDLLSRVPTLKWRNGVLFACFGGSRNSRNIEVSQVKDGALIIRLGREDFVVTKWKDGRRQKVSTKNDPRSEKKRAKSGWHRCKRHSRLHRITDECMGDEEDCI